MGIRLRWKLFAFMDCGHLYLGDENSVLGYELGIFAIYFCSFVEASTIYLHFHWENPLAGEALNFAYQTDAVLLDNGSEMNRRN